MKWKKVWSLLCTVGLPWGIITAGTGVYIKYWYIINHPREHKVKLESFDDIKEILLYAAVLMIWILFKNLQHKSSGRKIGLITWLGKVKEVPPDISSEKHKAQHKKVPLEMLSKVPDQFPIAKQGDMYVQFDLSRYLSYLIYGSPGSGKSCAILCKLIYSFHCDHRREHTFFVFDFKEGELYKKSCFPYQKNVRFISLESRTDFGWNVYYRLNGNSTDDDIIRELTLIADVLIESSNEKNIYFTESAKNILIFCGLYCYRCLGLSFIRTIDFITQGSVKKMLKQVMDGTENRPEMIKVRDVIGEYVDKDANESIENIFANLKVKTRCFRVESIRWNLEYNPRKCSPYDLEDGVSLFFYPGDTEVTKFVMQIIAKQLMYHCMHRDFMGKDLRQLVLIADECFTIDSSGSTGSTPLIDWGLLCSKARGFKVNVLMVWQSYSQIKQLHGSDYAESLMDDISGVVVYATNSESNAKVYSSFFSEYQEEKRSYTVGGTGDGTYSRSYDLKATITPHEILKLRSRGQCLFMSEGDSYIADAEGARYYRNPRLLEISEKCLSAHMKLSEKKETVKNNSN